jgi:hypothetical protein
VTVKLSHGGVDHLRMSGRSLKGDRFIVHPEVPAIAKLFVTVPDTKIWLTNPEPAGFLRWEGPFCCRMINSFGSIYFLVATAGRQSPWKSKR